MRTAVQSVIYYSFLASAAAFVVAAILEVTQWFVVRPTGDDDRDDDALPEPIAPTLLSRSIDLFALVALASGISTVVGLLIRFVQLGW